MTSQVHLRSVISDSRKQLTELARFCGYELEDPELEFDPRDRVYDLKYQNGKESYYPSEETSTEHHLKRLITMMNETLTVYDDILKRNGV